MRKTICLILAGFVTVIGVDSVKPGDGPNPKAVIAKAIKAVGGKKSLMKLRAVRWREKGVYYGTGQGLPYTGNFAIQYPNQFRMEIEGFFVSVFNKNKGWKKMGDSEPMNKKEIAQQRASQHCMWVASLVPFAIKAKGLTLKALGETKVGKKTAVGVKVSRKGYPDVSLYFDKKTGLLVKSAYRIASPEKEFKKVLQEDYPSDYKVFKGVRIGAKTVMKREGKVYIESQLISFEPVGKLDNKVFAKP